MIGKIDTYFKKEGGGRKYVDWHLEGEVSLREILDARTAVCMIQHMQLVASERSGDNVDYTMETLSVVHLPYPQNKGPPNKRFWIIV